ncbi:MAG TPA: hypothetical protein VK582_20500 [Pyrinomonadaceae bacterium]|nr:hypothetical protein [Pyrinomonadaceae bacterium]
MTIQITRRKWFFLFASMLIAASLISAGAFSAKRQQPKKQWPKEPSVTSMPPVFSKVKKLEVIKAWIVNPGTPAAGVRVEIRNNSDQDVMAVDLACGEGGVTKNGLEDEEHPIVVIKPHDTTTVEMNFGEMTFGAPLVVGGVIYGDGTEDGDEASLKPMHIMRAHDRAQRKAEKERQVQKGAPTP